MAACLLCMACKSCKAVSNPSLVSRCSEKITCPEGSPPMTAPCLLHPLHDVFIAHLNGMQGAIQTLQGLFQSPVGHDGAYDSPGRKMADLQEHFGANGKDIVTVEHLTGVIHHGESVSVAIKGKPDVQVLRQHMLLERFRMQGAALLIDVDPVWFGVQRRNLNPQFLKQRGSNVGGGAVGAVQADTKLYRACAAEGGFQKIGVMPGRGQMGLGTADRLAGRAGKGLLVSPCR